MHSIYIHKKMLGREIIYSAEIIEAGPPLRNKIVVLKKNFLRVSNDFAKYPSNNLAILFILKQSLPSDERDLVINHYLKCDCLHYKDYCSNSTWLFNKETGKWRASYG